jgi:hypothetical protein
MWMRLINKFKRRVKEEEEDVGWRDINLE